MKVDEIFQEWFALRHLSMSQLPRYGDFPAVYALRDSRSGDILKFGCAGCLRRRIFMNYLCGFGGDGTSTTQRIHHELFANNMIHHAELAWAETTDRAEANRKETELRAAYKKANGEKRPLWDRNG
jgi:hypothetical protein